MAEEKSNSTQGEKVILGKTSLTDAMPQPNFALAFGETGYDLTFEFRVNRTLWNRLKWWLFCRVFPVRIKKWEKVAVLGAIQGFGMREEMKNK